MQLEVYLPSGPNGVLNVADTDLVYNGSQFVKPEDALSVFLVRAPVQALSLPYKGVTEMLVTAWSIKALVQSRTPSSVPVTDPDVVHVPDLSPECICGITCRGVNLQYVQVKVQT